MTEPPRRRIPVAAEQSVREERRGFFRWAAILGVIIGIPLGVLGIPPLLNVFFDEPTVPVNGAYSEDGLTLWVEQYIDGQGPPRFVEVTLAVRGTRDWTFSHEGIELELSAGDPVAVRSVTTPEALQDGRLGRIVLQFLLPEAQVGAEPIAVRLPEPKVRFALTEEDH